MNKDKKCPCEMRETFSCDWNIDRDLGLYAPNSNFTISDRKIIIGTYSANDYMGIIEIDINYCPLCGISLKGGAEMKKDKEWLKEELVQSYLKESKIYLDGKEFQKARYFEISEKKLFNLIDQLDEPDERTQLEEAYKDILERHIFYYNKTKYQVIKEQIIPRFVADWIDAHDLHGNNPLREYRDLEIDFNEGWTNEKDAAVYHWINKNPYTFIDALRAEKI